MENKEELKQCTQCKEWKPATTEYFYKWSYSKDGLHSNCKVCHIARQSKHQKENYDEKKKYFHENYLNKKDYYFENAYRYKENNLEKYKEDYKKWLQNNPDKTKQYNEKRQHKNHNINKSEWENCKKYFNYQCAYCGLPLSEHYYTRNGITKLGDFHKEHVDHEGNNGLGNCIPSCGSCNSSKHEAKLEEWYNINNHRFSIERYDKIIKWITEDYKKYIELKKSKRKYNRKNKTA